MNQRTKIYILKAVEGWYDDDNVIVTLEADQLISKVNELHSESEDINFFVIEVWENNKKSKEEHFRNKLSLDDLIDRVKNFISS